MKRINPTIMKSKILIAAFLFFLGIVACNTNETKVSSWDYDLDLLTKKLEKYHPNPWENISREEYLQQVNIIKENSDKWNNEKIILKLMKVIADIGDGQYRIVAKQ